MKQIFSTLLALLSLTIAACGSKTAADGQTKHYQMMGEVMALNSHDQTATIKHGPITNWMEAMTMEYPIAVKSDFQKLHVGEKITATVDVESDAKYSLSNVKEAPPKR